MYLACVEALMAMTLSREAVTTIGAGGKTAVGYGYFNEMEG